MEENVFENPVEVRTAVPAPHFDDRRVVQRAQRVVPLNEIRTRLRLRRLLYLGAAFAIAMVLGAASALLAVHFKRSGSTVTQIQLANTDGETINPESVPIDPVIEAKSVEVEETPVEPVVTKKQTPVAVRPRVVVRDNEPNDRGIAPSEEEQLEQIREAVLYEQWQERRARRAERRERRNRGDRDLSRVDEIFEGPRRPERP